MGQFLFQEIEGPTGDGGIFQVNGSEPAEQLSGIGNISQQINSFIGGSSQINHDN
jgi:hypothetical protein